MIDDGKIKIVSASAGSGKTYRLTEVICEQIKAGVHPEGVVATTFTRKAAAELSERVRRRLIQEGLTNEAQRLSAARLGTVHSVCGGIVSDYAFELGLFPDVKVLAEDQAVSQFKRALSATLDPESLKKLASLDRSFSGFNWQEAIQRVVEKARSNGITPEGLPDCKKRSVKQLLSLLGPPAKGRDIENELALAIDSFLTQVDTDSDTTKGTANAIMAVKGYQDSLQRGGSLTWKDWASLGRIGATKKSDHLLEPLREAARSHLGHQRFHHELRQAIELVFDSAQAGYRRYQDYKREWGALDFTDQEFLALDLLNRPKVRSKLAKEIELLVVDEFQDTSPIQLAILLKLAEVSGQAVWVGDQKQSIYAFRETDPALMDACLEQLGRSSETETLRHSWRSRPGLVKLTSQVFAKAFATHGIPQEMVVLEPAHEEEPEGLGPFLERWQLQGKNLAGQNDSLAAAIAELLSDPEAKIRDRITEEARPVTPSDIGILCRTGNRAGQVANAVAAAGIKAELGRAGLMSTPEARLVLNGLRLWVDKQDRLAAAEIVRLVKYANDPDQWLAEVVADQGETFFALPEIGNVVEQAESNPFAGPVLALDLAIDAIKAVEFCLAWGQSDLRLANIETLRAHAVTYAQQAWEDGGGATPAGLINYLLQLAEEELDTQGTDPYRQAVTISTWHGAKGLEWPVTVLYELGKSWEAATTGVEVISDVDGFDLENPLAGRWISFLPFPYGGLSSGLEYLDRIKATGAWQNRNERELRQTLRVLYVGWTRARDRLVLAGKDGELTKGAMTLIADEGNPILSEPENGQVEWAGVTTKCLVRSPEPIAPVTVSQESGEDYNAPGPKQYPPAKTLPSSLSGEGDILERVKLGERMTLGQAVEPVLLGEVLHTFLAADRNDYPLQERIDLATSVLRGWGINDALKPDEMVAASDALMAFINQRWPESTLHRELPLMHRLPNGSLLNGQSDLVLETDDGFAVIDHKAFPGNQAQAAEHAKEFAGQLHAYSNALGAALEKECLGTWIHMPISSLVFRIGT